MHLPFSAATTSHLDPVYVEKDYQKAQAVDTVRFGETSFFYSKMLKICYVPYDSVQWAYLRAEENRMSMCCGRVLVDFWYLLLYAEGKQIAKIEFQKKESAMKVLKWLFERCPQSMIGYNEETKTQWGLVCTQQ